MILRKIRKIVITRVGKRNNPKIGFFGVGTILRLGPTLRFISLLRSQDDKKSNFPRDRTKSVGDYVSYAEHSMYNLLRIATIYENYQINVQ